MNEVKLCKDCKHCDPELKRGVMGKPQENYERGLCIRLSHENPETGRFVIYFVAAEREAANGACGPSGKLWEPRQEVVN